MLLRPASLLAAALVLLGSTTTLAEPLIVQSPLLAQARNRPGGAPAESWLRDLNLSPQQLEQMKKIRQQYQGQLQTQRQSLNQAQQELREFMAGNAPAEQIRQKHTQVRELRREMSDTQFETMLAIREILTPEQRRMLDQRMQNMKEGIRQRLRDRRTPPQQKELSF